MIREDYGTKPLHPPKDILTDTRIVFYDDATTSEITECLVKDDSLTSLDSHVSFLS